MLHKLIFIGIFLLQTTIVHAKASENLHQFQHTSDTSIFQAYSRAVKYYHSVNTDSALLFINEAQALAKKENNLSELANFLNKGAVIHDRIGESEKAIQLLDKAQRIAFNLGDFENAITFQANKGSSYISLNKFGEAAKHLYGSLELADSLDINSVKGLIFSNLGLLFFYQEDWDKSIGYYQQSIPYYLADSNFKSLALMYNNIGISYYYKDILDSVLFNFEKSLEMYVELDDKLGQTRPLYNIGEVYYTQGKYDKAFEYYIKSLNIEKEIGYVKGAAISVFKIGALYAQLEKYEEAFEYLNESVVLSDSVGDKSTLKDAYLQLSSIYQSKGDNSRALDYYILHSDLKDTIYNIEKTKQVAKLETIYQTEKKEQLIEFQQKELRGKTLRNIILIICLVFALGLAIHVILSNKRRRKINNLLRFKNRELAKKNRKITSSITYASLIQAAILPPQDMFSEYFPEHFILFEPKDIVSGDFYWITKKDENIIVAVADCTGHGVPGAFMSMLGMTFLNEIVNIYGVTSPDEVLNMLRKKIISALHLEEKTHDTRDGMDIALCNINLAEKTLQYSGAYRPLLIIRKGEQLKLTPDRMPIGYHKFKNDPFSCKKEQLLAGDLIYLFTDGYADQFGGEHNKKLTVRRFNESIMKFSSLSIDAQKEKFSETFSTWKGNNEQIDDVTIMGIRI